MRRISACLRSDDEPTVVEHQVRNQVVAEVTHGLPELVGLAGQLGEGLAQAVRDLHLPTIECPHELVLVVARHGERVAGVDHPHDQA